MYVEVSAVSCSDWIRRHVLHFIRIIKRSRPKRNSNFRLLGNNKKFTLKDLKLNKKHQHQCRTRTSSLSRHLECIFLFYIGLVKDKQTCYKENIWLPECVKVNKNTLFWYTWTSPSAGHENGKVYPAVVELQEMLLWRHSEWR